MGDATQICGMGNAAQKSSLTLPSLGFLFCKNEDVFLQLLQRLIQNCARVFMWELEKKFRSGSE